jgi:hypothetical protein
VSAEFPTLNDADVWAMTNILVDLSKTTHHRGGPCDRCQVRWSASDRAYYCGRCQLIVLRERSSRGARKARAAKAKPGSSGRRAETRTAIDHPVLSGQRVAHDKLWLVLRENYGDLSLVKGSLTPATPAERWSERTVTGEAGLTADDWLAKG